MSYPLEGEVRMEIRAVPAPCYSNIILKLAQKWFQSMCNLGIKLFVYFLFLSFKYPETTSENQ